MKKIKFLFKSVFLFSLFLSNCKQPSIKIGIILPSKGEASIYGKEALDGILMAVEEHQEKLRNKNVKIIIKDNKSEQNKTREIITLWGKDEKILCVIGPAISKNAFISAILSQRYFLPVILPTATHPLLTKIGDYVFRVTFNDSVQGAMLARFVYENLKKTKVAILYEANEPYSEALSRNFEKAFKNLGGEILVSEFFTKEDSIFYSKLDKINSFNPEVLFLPVYANYVKDIIRQSLEIKLNPIFIGGDGWYSEELIDKNKELIKNINAYISSPFSPDLPSEKVKNFVKKYTEKYGKTPNFASALSYDAMNIVYEILEKIELPDRKKFMDMLKNFEFEGVTGRISFKKGREPVKDVFILKVLPDGFKYFLTMRGE